MNISTRLLDMNKEAFIAATMEEGEAKAIRGGRDSGIKILHILKATMKQTKQLTTNRNCTLKK